MQLSNLVSEATHRALAYVFALNKQGYFPSRAEFDAYAANPDRKSLLADMVTAHYATSRESPSKYVTRVGWVKEKNGGLEITPLGRALLAALGEDATRLESPVEIVLHPNDALALSRVASQLGALGRALLVEPYFRLAQLEFIMEYTEIDRVLMSDQVETAQRKAVKHALDTIPMSRRIEVRVATKDKMHDRFAIPHQGPVRFMGTSLGSVGRRLTVIGQFTDASEVLRQYYEHVWENAELLAVGDERMPDQTQEAALPEAPSEEEGAPGEQ